MLIIALKTNNFDVSNSKWSQFYGDKDLEESEYMCSKSVIKALWTGGGLLHMADHDPFIKSQLACAHSTLGPYVVQIWSRYAPKSQLSDPDISG